MAIFQRVTEILTANLNDLVDRFEDPPAMLRSAVREMESAVDETLHAAAEAIAHERLLERDIVGHRRRLDRLRDAAATHLQRDDEPAARRALEERARLETLVMALDDQLEIARRHAALLREQVSALRMRLAEAQQMQRLYVARSKATTARRRLTRSLVGAGSAAASLDRFDRACASIARSEAECEAYAELVGDTLPEPVSECLDVELELEALRREIAQREPAAAE